MILLEQETFTSPQRRTKDKIEQEAIAMYQSGAELEEVMDTMQAKFGRYANLYDIVKSAKETPHLVDMMA